MYHPRWNGDNIIQKMAPHLCPENERPKKEEATTQLIGYRIGGGGGWWRYICPPERGRRHTLAVTEAKRKIGATDKKEK